MINVHLNGAAPPESPHLGCEGQERNAVQEGIPNPSGQVCSSRTECRKAGAWLSCQPANHIRHETRTPLMGHQDEFDPTATHGINKMGILSRRDTEDITDSCSFEGIHNHFRIILHEPPLRSTDF